MDHKISLERLERLSRQRNIVFGVASIMFVTNVMLAIGIVTVRREIIMVPGIEQEFRIGGGMVSASYLEESSKMILSHLLDLTPGTVMLKKEYTLRHTAASGIKMINSYFAEAQKQHDKYRFSTMFTPKNFEVNTSRMEVRVPGILTSWYGKEGFKDEEAEYMLRFEIKNGRPLLVNFRKFDKSAETGN